MLYESAHRVYNLPHTPFLRNPATFWPSITDYTHCPIDARNRYGARPRSRVK
jgi:hypothetical protein